MALNGCAGLDFDGIKHRCKKLAAEARDFSIPVDASGERLQPCSCKLTNHDVQSVDYSSFQLTNRFDVSLNASTKAMAEVGKAAAEAAMALDNALSKAAFNNLPYLFGKLEMEKLKLGVEKPTPSFELNLLEKLKKLESMKKTTGDTVIIVKPLAKPNNSPGPETRHRAPIRPLIPGKRKFRFEE